MRSSLQGPKRAADNGGAWAADPAIAYSTYFVPQGVGADLIATLDGFTRETVDAYAVESQRRAAAAWAEGRFAKSILPVRDFRRSYPSNTRYISSAGIGGS